MARKAPGSSALTAAAVVGSRTPSVPTVPPRSMSRATRHARSAPVKATRREPSMKGSAT